MTIEVLPNKFFLDHCKSDPAKEPFYGVIEVATPSENAGMVLNECYTKGRLLKVGTQGRIANYRKVTCFELDTDKSHTSKVLRSAVQELNYMFNYDLSNIQQILYCEYHVGDFYKMHVDVGEGLHASRKISLTWNLNPNEYEGGELCFYQPHTPDGSADYKSPSTNIIGFTSWLNHEVKPVTRGIRKCIVAFIGGRSWR